MGKRRNKTSIGPNTNVRNESPFKKKQFTPMQVDQSDVHEIPLKTVIDDLPPQVTPATMNEATSLQITTDSVPHFDTSLPRIQTVGSSDDEEILNDETALDISQITSDLDPESRFEETDGEVSDLAEFLSTLEIEKKLPAETQTESLNLKRYRNGTIRATISHERLCGVASRKARTFEIMADQIIDFNRPTPTLRAGWNKLCKDKLARVLGTIFRGIDNREDSYLLLAAVRAFDSFMFLDRLRQPVPPSRVAEFLVNIFEQEGEGWVATLDVGLDDDTSRRLSHQVSTVTTKKVEQEPTMELPENDEDYRRSGFQYLGSEAQVRHTRGTGLNNEGDISILGRSQNLQGRRLYDTPTSRESYKIRTMKNKETSTGKAVRKIMVDGVLYSVCKDETDATFENDTRSHDMNKEYMRSTRKDKDSDGDHGSGPYTTTSDLSVHQADSYPYGPHWMYFIVDPYSQDTQSMKDGTILPWYAHKHEMGMQLNYPVQLGELHIDMEIFLSRFNQLTYDPTKHHQSYLQQFPVFQSDGKDVRPFIIPFLNTVTQLSTGFGV